MDDSKNMLIFFGNPVNDQFNTRPALGQIEAQNNSIDFSNQNKKIIGPNSGKINPQILIQSQ